MFSTQSITGERLVKRLKKILLVICRTAEKHETAASDVVDFVMRTSIKGYFQVKTNHFVDDAKQAVEFAAK